MKNRQIIKESQGQATLINHDTTIESILQDTVVSEIRQSIQLKRTEYRNVEGLQRICNSSNKFVTNHSTSLKNRNVSINEYGHGYRFFYHKKYKNSTFTQDFVANITHRSNVGYTVADLYVTPQYKDFKTELVYNKICSISLEKWSSIYKTATFHFNTYHCRTFTCTKKNNVDFYEMKHGDPIKPQHLIAMMIYCNTDHLQRKFSETFRMMKDDETMQQIKNRHSAYYFLARSLREFVECFGMNRENLNDNTIRLYHGVESMFLFKSLFAFIKGPFSTTTEYNVAVNFAANKGLILELNLDIDDWLLGYDFDSVKRIGCVDTKWLSDYPNECELFCLGGLSAFRFNAIIEVSTSNNYDMYIKGLKQMTTGMRVREVATGFSSCTFADIPSNDNERQMVFRLLAHQFFKSKINHPASKPWKSIPLYIDQLMQSHCQHISFISLLPKKHIILDHMFKVHNHGWFDLNILTKIFPNVRQIETWWFKKSISKIKNYKIYESILSYVRINGGCCKLERLEFHILRDHQQDIKTFFKQNYQQQFEKCGWEIQVILFDPVKDFIQEHFGPPDTIIQYMKLIKTEYPDIKKMVDKMVANFKWILEPLREINEEKSEFNIWTDYDKLDFVHLFIQKQARSSVEIDICNKHLRTKRHIEATISAEANINKIFDAICISEENINVTVNGLSAFFEPLIAKQFISILKKYGDDFGAQLRSKFAELQRQIPK
eukprot:223578_1